MPRLPHLLPYQVLLWSSLRHRSASTIHGTRWQETPWGWAKSFGTIITYYYYHFGGEEWTTNLFYCSMVLLRASLVSTRVSGLWLPVWLKITSRHRQYRIRSLSRLIAFPCFSRRFICTLITLITLHTSLLISPETPPLTTKMCSLSTLKPIEYSRNLLPRAKTTRNRNKMKQI